MPRLLLAARRGARRRLARGARAAGSCLLAVSLVLTCLPAGALAQAVAEVPAGVARPLGGGGLGAAGTSGLQTPGFAQVPLGFNDPRFFVLQSISYQLGAVSPGTSGTLAPRSLPGAAGAAGPGGPSLSLPLGVESGGAASSPAPEALARSVIGTLTSAEAAANPRSPQVLAARAIGHALLAPESIEALAPALTSVHPSLGGGVVVELRRAAREARGALATDRKLLGELRGAVLELGRLRGGGGGASPDALVAPLERLFIGRLRAERGEDLRSAAPGVGAAGEVDARQPYRAVRLPDGPARLRPAPPRTGPQAEAARDARRLASRIPHAEEHSVRVADLTGALAELRGRSLQDPEFDLVARRVAEMHPDLGLDPRRTLLVPREPALLSLLRIPEDTAGAARVLTDGRRSLALLIVAAPPRGITRAELAEVLLHEAVHGRDRGIFRIPWERALEHRLLEGYTQRQTLARLVKVRAVLGLAQRPSDRYAPEMSLAESVIEAVGEEPLLRLARTGDDAVLAEALGPRWTMMKAAASLARDLGASAQAQPAALEAAASIAHRPGLTPAQFELLLRESFPDAPAGKVAEAVLRVRAELEAPVRGWGARLRAFADRLAEPLRPDFPARGTWRQAGARIAATFLGLTAITSSLKLAGAWLAGGVVESFLAPATMGLAPLLFHLLVRTPIVAAGEEAVYRVFLNGGAEKLLSRWGLSPRASALAAAVLSSAVFAAAHIPAQGHDPVNLGIKFLAGLVSVHLYKKFGYWAAVANHFLWNASVALAAAFPILTPLYVLAPLALLLPLLFRRPAR